MEYLNLGIVPDPRTDEMKSKDYTHADLTGSVQLNWVEKPQSEWKTYVIRDQDGSLSCCGQGSGKAVETMTGMVMSAHPPYRSRSNYPEGGMYLQNVGDVWKRVGSTLESLDTSQLQNETLLNRPIAVETPTKIGGYVMVDINIDAIAEAIELHKHCILIVHCNRQEWVDMPVYKALPIDFGHCICAVDYFLFNGKKVILIEDSWGKATTVGNGGQRLITEDFLLKRFVGAMYFTLPAPQYIFTRTLKFGMKGIDVKMLQQLLKDKGFFPPNQATTLNFGHITKDAVMAFQNSSGLVPDGIAGKLTVAELQK